jgi:hypothetical protein
MGETEMAGHENSNRNLRARAGVVLVSLGSLLMFGKLGLIAVQLPRLLASLGIDIYGVRVALGLTLLRVLRTIAFDHTAIFSFGCAILVLFFALVAIVAGLTLLRKRNVEAAQ